MASPARSLFATRRRPHRSATAALVAALLAPLAEAQDEPDTAYPLGRTVVTASRSPATAFDTPYATEVVEADTIVGRGYRTTPQILRDMPGVMVQKTAHGQASPYIRGFTGFRNLFLIDGIRLNNSVFRDGPNQYWSTVDPLSIDRLEVVKGPSSVLYGSDAIGGTVNAITRSPYTYGEGTQVGGQLYYRGATAESSSIARGEAAVSSGESWGAVGGLSLKHFGDLEGGRDTGTLPYTGYDEYDADVKYEHFLDEQIRLVLAYQRVRQDDVPRTHRTVFAVPYEGTTVGSELERELDQERDLVYAQLLGDDPGGTVDSFGLSLSWHQQGETRHRLRMSGPDRQGLDVGTLGLFAYAGIPSPLGRITVGMDYYRDQVDSFSSSEPVQGPVADDATYDLLGVYVQDEIEVNERLTFTLGGRFNYAAADADSVLDPATDTQTSLSDDWSALVGSARFRFGVTDAVNLFGGVSQGFRAPNLSDLTRLDTARTDEIEIPSPGLDAENFITYELGVKAENERAGAQVSFFYTDIDDLIQRSPNGDVIGTDTVVIKENSGDGHVYGIEAGASYDVTEHWTVFGHTTFLEGKTTTFPTAAPVKEEEYIDRLMPWTSQAGLRRSWAGGWVEALVDYAVRADKLSTRDASDTSRIPPGGTPGYTLLHLHGGWDVTKNTTLFAGLENVTDEDYRIHGSGINGPGRNLVFGLNVEL